MVTNQTTVLTIRSLHFVGSSDISLASVVTQTASHLLARALELVGSACQSCTYFQFVLTLAVSGWLHLQSSEPLFSQLIAMSGSPLIQPRPLAMLEKSFSLLVTALGAQHLSSDGQVKSLLAAPQQQLASIRVPVGPLVDGDLVRVKTRFSDLIQKSDFENLFPAIRHCKRLVMGDCQMDVSMICMNASVC